MIKDAISQRYAIYIGLLSSILTGLVLWISLFLFKEVALVPLLIFAMLFIFTITYIPIFYILNNFIKNRVKPIYDTIETIKLSEKKLYREIEDKDIIEEVKQEVIRWTKNKNKEINQLKANEKYRKEFLGNVSHELKTPIFNIQGYILTLLDGGLEDPNINRKYLERSEKNINRMITLVNDLETISRLESGELTLNFSDFNLLKLIEEVFDHQEMRASKHKISLQKDFNNKEEIYVRADRTRIFHVINNLVVNAIKYGREFGYCKIIVKEINNFVRIEIQDDGVGISQKNQARIFERFYRVDKSRSRNEGGSGLGLAIVKHLLEAHNQTIKLRSKENEGTVFFFNLEKIK